MIKYYPSAYGLTVLLIEDRGISDILISDVDDNLIDVGGTGSLSGSYPDGVVSDQGVPVVADIAVLLRMPDSETFDGLVIERTVSSQDGTWLVENLNKNLRFDVIARMPMRNDVIASNITPK